jgi:hypothetical protein
MCSVTGHCSFSENCVQVDRNVQEIKAGQVTEHHNSVWDSQSPIYEHYLWVRHRRGITVTMHRTEMETVTDCSFVAQQRTPSYCCPYNDHPPNAELEHSQQPSLQFRLDDLRFSTGWTHKEGNERLKIHRSWHNEGWRALLPSHTTKNLIFWYKATVCVYL